MCKVVFIVFFLRSSFAGVTALFASALGCCILGSAAQKVKREIYRMFSSHGWEANVTLSLALLCALLGVC